MSSWHVYILRCGDGSLYTGISTNVEARVQKHTLGRGAAYTRSHLPVTLIWTQPAESESAARKREAEMKRWSRQQKERFVLSESSAEKHAFAPSLSPPIKPGTMETL